MEEGGTGMNVDLLVTGELHADMQSGNMTHKQTYIQYIYIHIHITAKSMQGNPKLTYLWDGTSFNFLSV